MTHTKLASAEGGLNVPFFQGREGYGVFSNGQAPDAIFCGTIIWADFWNIEQ